MNHQPQVIPRIIYSLWLQGQDAAPDLVRLNFSRWRQLNPGYELKVLDETDVAELLDGVRAARNVSTPQALSNIVRLKLLERTGGVWVDATIFPTEPLDTWLPNATAESGFFAFDRPGPDRLLSSWFLAASAEHMLVKKWLGELERFWSVPRTLREGIPDDPVQAVEEWTDSYPYFCFHYLFQKLTDRDPAFAAAWERCVKMTADDPHSMQIRMGRGPAPDWEEIIRLAARAPLHKLNWQASYPLEQLAELADMRGSEQQH